MPANQRLLDFLLTRCARRLPDKVFLSDTQRRVTYAETELAAERFAAALAGQGVQRGDRVVVFCQNRVEVALAALGVLRTDGVFIIINPSTKAGKLRWLLEDSGAAAMVVDSATAPVAAQAREGLRTRGPVYQVGPQPLPGSIPWEEALAAPGDPPARRAIDVDLAALIYTSGSTGNPKGVMLTHANLRHTTWSISTYLENREDDVILDALPLAFDYGFYQVLTAMRVGASVLIEKGFPLAYPVLRRMQEEGATGFPGVPTMFALILALKDLAELPLPRLRYFSNTADALPPAHIRRLREVFPHVTLYSMYGLTECTRVAYLDPGELERRPRSVGKAIPNTEVWLEKEDGGRARPGEEGILMVRGAHVMAGYWRNEEATKKMLRSGTVPGERVLRSGDLFITDEDGFLYYVGRSDNIIKSRGEKVSPREVESA
ncbi:MAG: AMP-binding protein, partial [Deltaproteobacteria bacterium]|nr:AMP-binding protein [Deltaproteobacteria bacterium]